MWFKRLRDTDDLFFLSDDPFYLGAWSAGRDATALVVWLTSLRFPNARSPPSGARNGVGKDRPLLSLGKTSCITPSLIQSKQRIREGEDRCHRFGD
jgi:hypothetical protein